MTELQCNACNGIFPLSCFHKAVTTKRGYQYKCKSCVSVYDKSPTPEIREKKLSRLKQWREDNPEKREAQKKRHYLKNKDRIDQKAKDWYSNNKERYYGNAILRKYGITLDEYNALRQEQDYKCAICGDHENEVGKKMFVDHNHDTGKIRKLLCTKCNVGIGMLKDSAEVLLKAAQYLQEHNG
jgi:hypothetical protein